jgi:hypothetical protein
MRLGELTTVPWPITTTVSVAVWDVRTAAALLETTTRLASMRAPTQRRVDALIGLLRKARRLLRLREARAA